MISAIAAGFVLGLFSSLHCVGMCGPLAMALPVHHLNKTGKIAALLLYNTGRIITYALLGLLFGVVGKGFVMAGWQQMFSIVTGTVMLVFTILYFGYRVSFQPKWFQNFSWIIQKKIGRFLSIKSHTGYLLIGIINGLLPCGMVYVAIGGALITGNEITSTVFMASFGFATLLAMMMIGLLGTGIRMPVRNRIKKLTPAVMIFVALLLILRGLNLGIPYISPQIQIIKAGVEKVSCH